MVFEVRINASSVAKNMTKKQARMPKLVHSIIRESAMSEKRAVIRAIMPFRDTGRLSRSIIAKVFKKSARVGIAPPAITQATLLEYGPAAVGGYPRTIYLGAAGNDKIRQWYERKTGKSSGRITLGGKNTKWGKGNRRFWSNAARGRLKRFQNIIRKNIKKLGGK